MTHNPEHPLPEGVSRWAFVVPGAAVGFTAGALGGWLPTSVAAAVPLRVLSWLGPAQAWLGLCLWLAWWVWFSLAFAAAGGWTGYRIWAAGENPLPHRFASPANESGAIRTIVEP